MDYQKLIQEFAGVAQEYCNWVEETGNKGNAQLFYLQVLLSKLYCLGIQLPECEPTSLLESTEKPQLEHREILQYFEEFPCQYYSLIFNAQIVPSEEQVVGDIVDDLADLYTDLKDGLWYWESGSEVDAVFFWRLSLGVHWGRHALGAMYALYCFEQ